MAHETCSTPLGGDLSRRVAGPRSAEGPAGSHGSPFRPLRACHVIHALGPGGAERSLVALAAAAEGVGLDMSVVALTAASDDRYVRRLASEGVEVVELDVRGRWDVRALSKAGGAVRELAPDVVHTHLKHADIVGGHAARRLGLPMISTLHLIEDAPTLPGRAKRRAGVQVRERSAALTIAVSDALRTWYVGSFRVIADRVVVVRNGVTPPPRLSSADRALLRERLGVRPDEVAVACVAIMRPGKGHHDLLQALARLPSGHPVHLVLVGDGPLLGQLQSVARDLSLPVTFAGFRDDVPAVLQATDMVVHPARFDALPTALIEALAAGRPVLATEVGGVPEIVTSEVGRLLPPGDVAALATGMKQMAEDPELRRTLGAAAHRRFESEFDAGRWAGRLRHCYERALAAASPS